MVTTTSLKVGESLTIGLYFNDNYQLPSTCNLITYIGGVCIGNLFTQQPAIEQVGIYYTIRLSSQDTSKMRGYRDLIVVLDDPGGFGNKKTIIGGILFDRLADEFITTSENQGYNMLIGMTIDESVVSGNLELISALKGEKGDPGINGLEDAPIDGSTYARKDATWINLPGGGDMLKSVYDTSNNGIVDNAEALNGFTETDFATASQGALADSALQSFTETDPTVPSWAKTPSKPTYTYNEVGAQPAGTYSTDIHSNITALNAVTNVNTGDETTSTIGALIETTELETIIDTTKIAGSVAGVVNWFSGLRIKEFLTGYFQSILVSGTNIKTVNGNSLLGGGDIVIESGGAYTNEEIKTAYESNEDTNAFTNDLLAKLQNISAGAQVNDTAADIKTKLESITIEANKLSTSAIKDLDTKLNELKLLTYAGL